MRPGIAFDASGRVMLVLVLALGAYFGALDLGFAHDDVALVERNELVQTGPDFARIATSDYWAPLVRSGLWRPLVIASFSIERLLFGSGPLVFHATNVFLHAGVSIALLFLLDRLRTARRAALFAALLFAAHPIHTEAVANVAGRAELMAALFSILALRSHLAEERTLSGALRAAGLLLLALLSKEHAAVVPFVAIVADLAARRPFPAARHAALFAVLGAYLLARALVLGGFAPGEVPFVNNPLVAATPFETALAVPALFLRAAALMVLPVRLSADYSYRSLELPASLGDPAFLAGLLLLGLAAAALVNALRRRNVLVAAALAIALFPYAVVSHAIVPLGTLFGERLLYLPSAGAAALLGAAIARTPLPSSRVVIVATTAAFALLTALRTPAWRNNWTLWPATVRRFPENAKAQAYLAQEILGTLAPSPDPRRLAAARAAAEASARAYPEYATAHYVLGKVALAERDDARAIAAFEKSIALEDAFLPRVALGDVRARRDEWEEAEKAFAGAVALRPASALAQSNLAAARATLGREREAREGFERALAIDPNHRDATLNLFRLLLGAKDPAVRDPAAARALARRVLAIDPSNAEARALAATRPE